ncbi:hypothetical protein P7K49_012919, partial [Saguinus oedipus]
MCVRIIREIQSERMSERKIEEKMVLRVYFYGDSSDGCESPSHSVPSGGGHECIATALRAVLEAPVQTFWLRA